MPSSFPIDSIKKDIDALIDYNKSLIKRVAYGSKEEVFEIMISMFLDLSEMPTKLRKEISDELIKSLKTQTIDHILSDLRIYEYLNQSIKNDTNVDHLYLRLFLTHKIWLAGVDSTSIKKFEEILSYLYGGAELARQTKEMAKRIKSRDAKSPLMAEMNALQQMLVTLQPEVSPLCLRLIEETVVHYENKTVKIELEPEATNWQNKKTLQFLRKNPDKELINLLTKNIEVTKSINSVFKHDRLQENYVAMFENMKVKYEIEDQMILRRKKIEAKNRVLEIQTNRDVEVSEAKDNQAQAEQVSDKKSAQTSVVESKIISPVPENKLDNELSNSQASDTSNIPLPTVEESVTKVNEEVIKDEKQEESYESFQSSNYAFFPKKEKTIPQQKAKPKHNVFNLNKDQQDIYLKVFDKIPYDSINLRALVNLTQAFGGTFKTTGSNRCRIEMKNIYAHLLVPEEALEKACDKATVTMHGGGHRSKRSLNNDRENAPDYLIEQFKNAFIRAGYTPANAGLGVEQGSEDNSNPAVKV